MKNYVSFLILIVIVSGLYLVNEKGINMPLISNYKRSFYFLLIVGIALCANSPLKNMFADVWSKPFYLIGSLLGLLIIILLLGVVLRQAFNLDVVLIKNFRQAFFLLAVLVLSKSGVTLIHRVLFNG